jgi:heat shock protein HslJ
MKKYLLILLFMSLVVSACTPQAPSLVGTWKLTAYGPSGVLTPAVPDAEAILTFNDDGIVGGSGGCNSLGGKYEVNGSQITFSEITSTLMACEDPRMAQEAFVTQVLTGAAEFEIENNTLTLTNNDMVLVFTAVSYP